MNEGSWVGLDVHARSVVAGVIDVGSGEVRSLRVVPGNEGTVAWLKTEILERLLRLLQPAVSMSSIRRL